MGLFALLIVSALLRNIPALLGMYAVTLVLAATSALPLGFFIKRVWLFIPIFTGIVVLPATLSVVIGGHVVVPLWHWHGHAEGLTREGLTNAGLIVTRVAVSVSLVVLLSLTTPWVKLLAALRSLGVPRMFVLVIGIAYRYIFLLLGSVTEMYEARKARSVGAEKHDRASRQFLFATAGFLFGKCHHLSEEVHQAMVSRGYRGDAKTVNSFRLAAVDAWFLVAVFAVACGFYLGDRSLGR